MELHFAATVAPYGEAVQEPRVPVKSSALEGTVVGLEGGPDNVLGFEDAGDGRDFAGRVFG